jgi:hypothetical protein
VRAALADGSAGLLVPADDLDALVEAIVRLSDERELRSELVARGFDVVTGMTLEAELDRVTSFMAEQLGGGAASDAERA